jgi:hypothetical protein
MRCGLPSSACATGSPAEKEPAAVHPLAPRPALLGVTFVTASLCQFHAEPSARRLADGAHALRRRFGARARSARSEIRESRVGVSAKWRTAFPNHFTRGQLRMETDGQGSTRMVATTKHTKGTKGPSRTFGPFCSGPPTARFELSRGQLARWPQQRARGAETRGILGVAFAARPLEFRPGRVVVEDLRRAP